MTGTTTRWPTGDEHRPVVIGVAGGSGSGKTTITEAVVAAAGSDLVSLINHDAYYRSNERLSFEQRAAINYDHPDAFETEMLVEHLRLLRGGEAVAVPVYDFARHLRTADRVKVEPGAVVIVEGILVLVEVELRRLMDLKIYIDTDPDLRVLRRMQRDILERGRTMDSVMAQYLETVRPMHHQFVEPSKRYADIIVPEGYNPNAVGTVTAMIRDVLGRR
ncbi:MAG: uridine kinase [Actinomycetota bacterium]|nr:uridine kinase [Actinomycetota bacterium]